MSAARLARPDLRVWLAGGALALALHASFALRLVQWHDPIPGDNGSEAVLIDLAPLMQEPQTPTQEDLAPGPLQQEAPAAPEPPKEEPQQQIEENIEPLPTVPNAEAVLPKRKEKPVVKPKPVQPPAPATTAPPRPHPSAAQVSNWHRQVAIALQRHKGYPAAAQARGETGIATVRSPWTAKAVWCRRASCAARKVRHSTRRLWRRCAALRRSRIRPPICRGGRSISWCRFNLIFDRRFERFVAAWNAQKAKPATRQRAAGSVATGAATYSPAHPYL